ncbi:Rho GTPase-activating protein 31 [Collichthys lucidus]|uniref:Rho GTPase-activating protein 31 n=1 Tax=Collichthys lucidus TaxID=240159 RepID=A0A4U5V983_COLLU|nr:Rho GTPase-activating protein 31 [Collichthys lucidus]
MKLLGRTPQVWRKDGLNSCSYKMLSVERQPLYVNVTVDIVPQVLKKCAEFIEEHGIVDGIYRLSGVTSNIQRLRQEFSSEACPDLTKEVYLQDIHCVGSLCKLYFRELPNPLLTYELYSRFTEVVSVQGDHERLLHIQRVVKELPTPHFRTLEYLTKHLAHLATLSTYTNMHTRNLALVWAPNLLRIEFHVWGEVRHPSYQRSVWPMKLMSLEEAQARSLSPNHPVHRERQRENSLPDTSTATLFHTVIDISDSKRKFSGKSKKWKSIFNLGRSVDSKGKLSRNGSVFIRAPGITDDDRSGNKTPAGGIFVPDVKSRTLGSDSLYDLNEHEQNWEFKGNKAGGATGGWSSSMNQKESPGASAPPQKTLPEQLKVFKGDDLGGYKPTSPKNRRMLYSGSSHSSSSRPSFPGSFFPLESSPRHQRRAVNISEPFAVSVPLRVSAVISSNSTPCRGHAKDKAATLKPSKESCEPSDTIPQLEPKKKEGTEKATTVPLDDTSKQVMQEVRGGVSELDPNIKGGRDAVASGKEVHNQPRAVQLDKRDSAGKELWSDLPQELKITEPEIDLLDDTFKPVFGSKSTCSSGADYAAKKPEKNVSCEGPKKILVPEMDVTQRLSVCLEEKRNTLELPHLDTDDGCGGNSEELDLVEPWEDLSSTKQWVTSPLHSPDMEELFNQLSPFSSQGEGVSSEEVDKKASLIKSTEHLSGNVSQTSNKPETKWMCSIPSRLSVNSPTQAHNKAKQKNTVSSQRFPRQMSYEAAAPEKQEENDFPKHRPYSLNLDLGHRCIRDISNQQTCNSSEFSSCQRGLLSSSVNNGLPSDLELFLNDRQAPLRRNSAPVSVSSVRTAFMIKTCQAKAVPVVPPKVQYSQIPHSRREKDTVKQQEQDDPKMNLGKNNTPPPVMTDLKEELENKEPEPNHQKNPNVENCPESIKTTSSAELPVIPRRQAPSLEVFVDCPRPNRGTLLQRPSFRNRQRPQSLILLSPPFPIMDYPPSGDDGRLLSSIKSLNDTSAGNVFSKETADGISLQNKMTIPKSGQRLETSTSCFYQPQRRSMIFDSRSHRQIE